MYLLALPLTCHKALYSAKEENKTSIERAKNAECKSQNPVGDAC